MLITHFKPKDFTAEDKAEMLVMWNKFLLDVGDLSGAVKIAVKDGNETAVAARIGIINGILGAFLSLNNSDLTQEILVEVV